VRGNPDTCSDTPPARAPPPSGRRARDCAEMIRANQQITSCGRAQTAASPGLPLSSRAIGQAASPEVGIRESATDR